MSHILIPALLLVVPFLFYPLVLAALARVRPLSARVDARFRPSIALVIPAFNEERVIATKLETCLALDYPKSLLRIVVVSESTDRTNEIVERFADRGVELRRFARVGKGVMLSTTVPSLAESVLAFTDADIDLAPNALKELVLPLSDPRIGCVVGNLHSRSVGGSAGTFGQSLYWQLEKFLRRSASRRFAVLGASGALYAIRRDLYRPLTAARADDFEVAVNVRLQGRGVVFVEAAHCFETSRHSTRAQFARRARVVSWYGRSAMLLLSASLRQARYWLALQIVAHKILRWTSPIALLWLVASLSAAISPLVMLFPGIALVSTGLAVFADARNWTLPQWILLLAYATSSGAASVLGLTRALRPRERNVWDPQAQRR